MTKTRIVISISLAVLFIITGCLINKPRQPLSLELEDVGCEACHGKDNEDVMSKGAHRVHNNTGNACTDCHMDNQEEHTAMDSMVEMSDGRSIDSTFVCDSCHGTGTNYARAFWSKPSGYWLSQGGFCESCHDGSSIIKGVTAPDVMKYYDHSGHGNTGKFPQTLHGQEGPGYKCVICHDPDAVGHVDDNKGDSRLRISNNSSGLCLDCHRVGQTQDGALGYRAASQATVHSREVSGAYPDLDYYNYQCRTCHNPHGTANLAMINDTIDGGMDAGPYPVVFTDSSQFEPTWPAVDGVCDVCHEPGKEPHFYTARASNHNEGDQCWRCHTHTKSWGNLPDYPILLTIIPDSATFNLSDSFQFKAQVTTNYDSIFDITALADWSSSGPAVVSIDNSGKAIALSGGTSAIYASYQGLKDTANVLVDIRIYMANLISLSITPRNPSVSVGDSLQLMAVGTFPGNVTADVADSVSWATSNPAVAGLDGSNGMVYAKSSGSAVILAFYSLKNVNASVNVTVP